MKLDIPLTELTPASISRLLTLRECKVTEDTLTLTIDDTSAQDADHKGIVLMDLPEEDLLATVHPLVTDTKLLTRYNLYKVEVHYHEDRLTISAVCHEDRPFTLHYNKPPICKVKGRLGKLATMELLRLNKCRIIFNDFDEHSMLHLREAINVLIKDSRGLVSNIEVHFQKSECEIDVDALVMWFCIYRDLSPYLSSHVTFEKKHNARYVFTSMDKRHDQSEHDLFRSLARKGKRLYNKFSPFHETRQFSFQTQSWSMLIWNTVAGYDTSLTGSGRACTIGHKSRRLSSRWARRWKS